MRCSPDDCHLAADCTECFGYDAEDAGMLSAASGADEKDDAVYCRALS